MGLSGVFMSLSLSLLQNNGQSWFQEFVGLVERESLFLLRRERVEKCRNFFEMEEREREK